MLFLITGINGFIAAHTAEQLLAKGHKVRGTIRSNKIDTLSQPAPTALEVVTIDDIASGDFTEALKGVDGVIHIAAPLPGAASREVTFKSAIDGTLNVVRQAQKAGVKKVVVTSTFGTLLHPNHYAAFAGLNFTEENWGGISDEEFDQHKDDPLFIYMTAKTRAEQALWEFAKVNPEMDISTIIPGYVLGPYSRLFVLPKSASAMGTNSWVYEMMNKGRVPNAPNWIVDVRDIARAHAAAALTPFPSQPGSAINPAERRFIINAQSYTWKEAVEHLLKTRPVLNGRFIPLDQIENLPGPVTSLDTTRAKNVLGIDGYIHPETTFEQAVDDLLLVEKNLGQEPVQKVSRVLKTRKTLQKYKKSQKSDPRSLRKPRWLQKLRSSVKNRNLKLNGQFADGQ
ncbi:hypothetical protein CPB83DRAFT_856531 [Crepidotus variabilis]|uniref:NAD-dependent epimerase/dehydratase domain-containing protein n=1 Tax=Crepidotus variabilis TaxID=179855 RepID=A0A9P6EDN9_9AGAR|nr:hypothetical protein CPB83DRAFT_856531 [Crepidotus variabilis]